MQTVIHLSYSQKFCPCSFLYTKPNQLSETLFLIRGFRTRVLLFKFPPLESRKLWSSWILGFHTGLALEKFWNSLLVSSKGSKAPIPVACEWGSMAEWVGDWALESDWCIQIWALPRTSWPLPGTSWPQASYLFPCIYVSSSENGIK